MGRPFCAIASRFTGRAGGSHLICSSSLCSAALPLLCLGSLLDCRPTSLLPASLRKMGGLHGSLRFTQPSSSLSSSERVLIRRRRLGALLRGRSSKSSWESSKLLPLEDCGSSRSSHRSLDGSICLPILGSPQFTVNFPASPCHSPRPSPSLSGPSSNREGLKGLREYPTGLLKAPRVVPVDPSADPPFVHGLPAQNATSAWTTAWTTDDHSMDI